jgi:hypothetical protein
MSHQHAVVGRRRETHDLAPRATSTPRS